MFDTATASKQNKMNMINKSVLVTGGGYIGTNIAGCLARNGYTPVIVGRSLNRLPDNVNDSYQLDLPKDMHMLDEIVKRYNIDTVIHTASSKDISESNVYPDRYYKNNVVMTIQLLNKCVELGIHKVLFASSSSVYGNINGSCFENETDLKPTNPYGQTKLICEKILQDYYKAYNLYSISFRIFNVAGLCKNCEIGDKQDSKHLIPSVIRAGFQTDQFVMNGKDYITPDGTCMRDYVHVTDVADVFITALNLLGTKIQCDTFNVGTGIGITNEEIVEKISKHTGAIDVVTGPRRIGDPDMLVADMTKTNTILNWKPKYSGIDNIIQSAVQWYKASNKKEIN